MKIGFFDSGLGGLLVLKAVAKHMPDYDYEYFGDTKHLPYGEKTEEEIYELTKAGVTHLFEKDCTLVVIACNTASAETLRRLQDEFLPTAYPERKILGVIIPVIEEVVASDCKRLVMFATNRTVSSGKYHIELSKRIDNEIKIEAIATPDFVPLIESGKSEGVAALAQALIEDRLAKGTAICGVILGCTHYALLADTLRAAFNDEIKVFSQADIIPHKLEAYLQAHPEIEETLTKESKRNVHLSEHKAEYDSHIQMLLEGRFM